MDLCPYTDTWDGAGRHANFKAGTGEYKYRIEICVEACDTGCCIRHLTARALGGRPIQARLGESLRAAGKQWCRRVLFWSGGVLCAG